MYQLKPEDWIDEDREVPANQTNPNVTSYVREFLRMTARRGSNAVIALNNLKICNDGLHSMAIWADGS